MLNFTMQLCPKLYSHNSVHHSSCTQDEAINTSTSIGDVAEGLVAVVTVDLSSVVKRSFEGVSVSVTLNSKNIGFENSVRSDG